jgi:hypothetical protein
MTPIEAKVGTRIRSLLGFSGVPKGTEGVIDEDYGPGVTIAWDLPTRPLPKGYRRFTGLFNHPSWDRPCILRDGFDKKTELEFLEIVKEEK